MGRIGCGRLGRRLAVLVAAGGVGAVATFGGLTGAAADSVAACGGTLTAPGTFSLAEDCPNGGITVTASNVTLKLNGHTIGAPSSAFFGVFVNDSQAPIRSVAIQGPGVVQGAGGIRLGSGGAGVARGVSDSIVKGVTVTFSGGSILSAGLELTGSATGNMIIGNTISNVGSTGMSMLVQGSDNMIVGNTTDSSHGVVGIAVGGTGNSVLNNTITGAGASAVSYGIVIGSRNNIITSNMARNNGIDLFDTDSNCDSNNLWRDNIFSTAQPATCIR